MPLYWNTRCDWYICIFEWLNKNWSALWNNDILRVSNAFISRRFGFHYKIFQYISHGYALCTFFFMLLRSAAHLHSFPLALRPFIVVLLTLGTCFVCLFFAFFHLLLLLFLLCLLSIGVCAPCSENQPKPMQRNKNANPFALVMKYEIMLLVADSTQNRRPYWHIVLYSVQI